MKRFFLFLPLLVISFPAFAETTISGRVFGDFWLPATDDYKNSFHEIETSLWFQGKTEWNNSSSVRWNLATDLLDAAPGNATSSVRTRLREGYYSFSKNGVELKVGQQIIPWGGSDVYNPTDYLTARDYTFFNPDEEVRRLGAASMAMIWTPANGASPFNLTAVWTPVFPKSTPLVPDSVLPSSVNNLGAVSPKAGLSNSELAVKVGYSGEGWDAALSAFHGWNHTPRFYAVPKATGFDVAQNFQRMSALGIDASLTKEQWVFRAESAYKFLDGNPADPSFMPSHIEAVIGVEKPFKEHYRMQLQGIMRLYKTHVFPDAATGNNPIEKAANMAVAATNGLLMDYQHKFRSGLTLRLSYAPSGKDFSAEAFGAFNAQDEDYMFRPSVTYRFTDNAFLQGGWQYYHGGPVTPFGSLSAYRSVFTEFRVLF